MKKIVHDYDTLRLKFENDNKIFERYKDFFMLLDETFDKISLINTRHL